MNKKLLVILVAAVVLVAGGIYASIALANHSWGGYHWARTANPFTLKLGDNVTSAWDAYLGTASGDWSNSSVLDTAIETGQAKGNCGAVTGTVQVCNKKYGFNGWLGVAQIWVTSELHIVKGTTKLNDSYFNTKYYNTPAWRNLVMCQEVGHTLGLGHTNEDPSNVNEGTCMDYTNDPDGTINRWLSNEHPNQHDYDMLLDAIMYGHSDSTNTTTSSIDGGGKGKPTAVGQDIDLDNPSAWGKAVKKDARGNNSLYERDLGNGEKLFTFVIWAN